MDISELTTDENVALVGLLREVIQADDVYSDAEREQVALIIEAMGEDRWSETVALVQERFASRADLKEHAKTIARQPARELIYDFLEKVATSDALDDAEDKPLKWLASWWDIR